MLPRPAPVISIQAEVLANLRSQAIGGHTVADLGLPDAFLRRVADRITRDSFQERFRVVQGQEPTPVPERPADLAKMQERPVERRSFRASARSDQPTDFAGLPQAERQIATAAMQGLPTDGLLLTVAKTIRSLGSSADPVRRLRHLDRLGIPIDLLDWFSVGPARGGAELVAWMASELTSAPPDKLRPRLSKADFRPTPTIPGFLAAPDSGQTPLDRLRVQVPFARYWIGPGDGSALDLVRSICEQAPGVDLLVCTPSSQAKALKHELSLWSPAPRATIIEVPGDLSQWAQDNAKSGVDAAGTHILLAPRYAIRGEPASNVAPGEDDAITALIAAGLRTARSPLLFQGGNILVVQERERRTLVVGEAEIWRNVALGLTESQARDALAVELGCTRIVVLPAASFHIDQEVSIRSGPSGTMCFVADPVAGARSVLRCALDIAERHGTATAAAREALASGDHRAAADLLGRWLTSHERAPGIYPSTFADAFSAGPADHGASNVHRVLLALDLLAARDLAGMPGIGDRSAKAYLDALVRQFADRRLVRRALEDAGWRVAPIPCMPDPHRGLAPINMIHAPHEVYLPEYGGSLGLADSAAAEAIARVLPEGCRIRTIRSAESQRRSGAVRCAVATVGR